MSDENRNWLSRYGANLLSPGGSFAFATDAIYWTRLQETAMPPEELRPRFKATAEEAGRRNRDVYVGIDLLDPSRTTFAHPIPWPQLPEQPFGNAEIREAYRQECLEIVTLGQEWSDGRVTRVALVMEMDGYYYNHPEDYDNLIAAVGEARGLVKANFPDVTVGVYFTLAGPWERYLYGHPEIYQVIFGNSILNDPTAGMDFLDGTAYPLGVLLRLENGTEVRIRDPEETPVALFSLAAAATVKPFHVPERGWPSTPVLVHEQEFYSDEDMQRRFVNHFFTSIVPNMPAAKPIVLACWFVGHDIPGEVPYFRTMGLWHTRITVAKRAWGEWRNY